MNTNKTNSKRRTDEFVINSQSVFFNTTNDLKDTLKDVNKK